jgi:hypothetical protein
VLPSLLTDGGSPLFVVWKQRSSWYGDTEEETHSYEQPTYTSYDRSYEQPTYTSYDRSYEQPTYTSYDRSYEQPSYTSYDRSYEQPYSFHAVPDETTWFPNQTYQDVYKEEEPQFQVIISILLTWELNSILRHCIQSNLAFQLCEIQLFNLYVSERVNYVCVSSVYNKSILHLFHLMASLGAREAKPREGNPPTYN